MLLMAVDINKLLGAPAAESESLGQLYVATYNWLGQHAEVTYGPQDPSPEVRDGLPIVFDPPVRSYSIGLEAARRIVPRATETLAIDEDLEIELYMPHYLLTGNTVTDRTTTELCQPECTYIISGDDPTLPDLTDFLRIKFNPDARQWVSSRDVSAEISLVDTYLSPDEKITWSEQIKRSIEREQIEHMTQPEAAALKEIVDNLPAIHTVSSA